MKGQPEPKLWHPALDALTIILVLAFLSGLPDFIFNRMQ